MTDYTHCENCGVSIDSGRGQQYCEVCSNVATNGSGMHGDLIRCKGDKVSGRWLEVYRELSPEAQADLCAVVGAVQSIISTEAHIRKGRASGFGAVSALELVCALVKSGDLQRLV